MYYSNGNYEAFARPKKPEGIDSKNAYIIGTGLAALSAACYLVRDAQMPGDHIHVFEKDPVPGGACDGANIPGVGYVMRGGREMDNHFEVMWDLFRSIPSIETDGVSVLDEYYWLNKEDPNYSLCRSTKARGVDGGTNGKFALSDKASMEIMKLFFTPNEELYGKKISDFFDDEVFDTNFWMYWRTMFAFENWHSALEMKLYLKRYIHHIGGLPDFTALRFTRYNQYESIILPMVRYLEGFGVQFHYNTKVTDVKFDIQKGRKLASSVTVEHEGETTNIDLTENDLLFITNGGCVESCTVGAQDKATGFDPTIQPGNGWDLWKKIAAQDPSFGHPEKFCSEPELSNWESATITTLDDKIPQYIRKICKRDPFSGHTVTGGIVTVKDSSWLLSWTLNRQQQFRDQPKNQLCVWVYGLFSDKPGNYGDDAACDGVATERVTLADLLDILRDLVVQRSDGGAFPVGMFRVGAELFRIAECGVLCSDLLPQIPAVARPDGGIKACGLVLRADGAALHAAAVRDEDEVVFREVDGLLLAVADDVDALSQLVLGVRAVELDVCDLHAVVELDVVALEVLDHREDHGLVLVILREAQRREIGQAADVGDIALEIELHFQSTVPVFKGKHGAPVQPEVGVQHFIIKEIGDLLVLQLLVGGEEELHDLHSTLIRQAELAIGVGILAAVDGGTAQGEVGVLLVQPVILVQHAGTLGLQRRDGVQQIPHNFEVVIHLAAAAHHIADIVLVAVAGTAGQRVLLKHMDVVALHLAVTDQVAGGSQGRQTGADEVSRFIVNALRLFGVCKCFVVATGIIHTGNLL